MTSANGASPNVLADFFRTSEARCPSCGYSLRGCESDRCPECGAQVTVGVIVTRSVSTWWLAGLFGAAISSAMSIFLLWPGFELIAAILYNPMMMAQVRSGFAPMSTLPRWNTIWLLTILTIFGCLLLAWLIGSRHSFNRWAAKNQILVGGGCLVSPLVFLAIIQIATQWM